MTIAISAIGIFALSFLVSMFISRFIAKGSEDIRTVQETDTTNELFLILCFVCVPILVIIVAHLLGES